MHFETFCSCFTSSRAPLCHLLRVIAQAKPCAEAWRGPVFFGYTVSGLSLSIGAMEMFTNWSLAKARHIRRRQGNGSPEAQASATVMPPLRYDPLPLFPARLARLPGSGGRAEVGCSRAQHLAVRRPHCACRRGRRQPVYLAPLDLSLVDLISICSL